ncbi:hypothetical protein AcW1_008973 [Taiwanofungus camphoratus]|nr:hypothetical protein AcW1_008973 [Antrodia cinnamomea]
MKNSHLIRDNVGKVPTSLPSARLALTCLRVCSRIPGILKYHITIARKLRNSFSKYGSAPPADAPEAQSKSEPERARPSGSTSAAPGCSTSGAGSDDVDHHTHTATADVPPPPHPAVHGLRDG